MIYEYLLMKGTVFLPRMAEQAKPYPSSPHAAIRPIKVTASYVGQPYYRYRNFSPEDNYDPEKHRKIGLLSGVSRLVQREATEIYYKRNQFIFPICSWITPFWCMALQYRDTGKFVRDLSLAFDMQDFGNFNYNRHNISRMSRLRLLQNDKERVAWLNSNGKSQGTHNWHYLWLRKIWKERMEFILDLRLDRLQISLEECHCPMGCCRVVHRVVNFLVHPEWRVCPPKVTEIIGWENEDEKNMIKGRLELANGQTQMKIRFIGKSNEETMLDICRKMDGEDGGWIEPSGEEGDE
ncbi:hypothetical protein F5B20DRAFT_552774 [Whalleya microplaca]|nr:hypothetical protein F5B20DRAFT_552774 [Whalleya microplaca]